MTRVERIIVFLFILAAAGLCIWWGDVWRGGVDSLYKTADFYTIGLEGEGSSVFMFFAWFFGSLFGWASIADSMHKCSSGMEGLSLAGAVICALSLVFGYAAAPLTHSWWTPWDLVLLEAILVSVFLGRDCVSE